jgi:hypothetical protein
MCTSVAGTLGAASEVGWRALGALPIAFSPQRRKPSSLAESMLMQGSEASGQQGYPALDPEPSSRAFRYSTQHACAGAGSSLKRRAWMGKGQKGRDSGRLLQQCSSAQRHRGGGVGGEYASACACAEKCRGLFLVVSFLSSLWSEVVKLDPQSLSA